jgi:hypothetical protein
VSSRACRSPNHTKEADQLLKDPLAACRFKCPKCRKWFCSVCEGTTDGFKTCDACWADIMRLSEQHHTLTRFKKMVHKYAYRKQWREILQEVGL